MMLNKLLLGVIIAISFSVLLVAMIKSDSEIDLVKTQTELSQEGTSQISPSINFQRIKGLPDNVSGPKSYNKQNEIASEISFNIFQECSRDVECVHRQMMELSKTSSKDVVLFVATDLTYLWEKEHYPCHQVAHHMGMFLVENFDGDFIAALSGVENVCGNAIYHGIMENYLQTKVLLDDTSVEDLDIVTPCITFDESQTSNTFRQCVHGVGHGLAVVYEFDVIEAVKRCDGFENPRARYECADGLFMQNHNQYFENTGKGAYREDDLLYPCNFVTDVEFQEACYQYQGNIILSRNNFSYTDTFKICEELPIEDSREGCTRTVSQYMTDWYFSNNFVKIVEMCNDVNTNHPNSCIESAVYSLIIYGDKDPMIVLCPLFRGEQRQYCEQMNYWVLNDNDRI